MGPASKELSAGCRDGHREADWGDALGLFVFRLDKHLHGITAHDTSLALGASVYPPPHPGNQL